MEESNMEAGQLLVLLLSFCHYISRIVEERVNYEQDRFTFIITLPNA